MREMMENEMMRDGIRGKRSVARFVFVPAAVAGCLAVFVVGLFLVLPQFNKPNHLAMIYPFVEEQDWQHRNYFNQDTNGQPIEPGDNYSTDGLKSSVLFFANGARARVFQNTDLSLRELNKSETDLSSLIYLERGRLECYLRTLTLTPHFGIITDFALLEVTGTHFTIEVQPEKTLHVTVNQGSVKINHFYESLRLVNESGIVEENKRSLASLLENSSVLILGGQRYTLEYALIHGLQERINYFTNSFIESDSQDKKKAFFHEIELQIGFFQNMLKKAVSPTEGLDDQSSASSGVRNASEADFPITSARDEDVQVKTDYLLSTLEEQDPFKALWRQSGPKGFFSITSQTAFQGLNALKIEVPSAVSEIFAYYLTLDAKPFLNKKLTLRVWIKTDTMQGQGIALAIRTDETSFPGDKILSYASTRDKFTITGTVDWQEYILTMDESISPRAKSVSIYLLYLPRTQGSVFFDNITLESR
jgi:hypothetical protein